MKKVLSVILALNIVLCLFSGCGGKKTEDLKIGLAAPYASHGWVAGVAYYAEKYCKAKNLTYNLTVSKNAEEMEKNINELVAWGADVLIVWPQWTGMESAINKVLQKDIPVVSFDVDINCEGVNKVTGNNYDMGYKCAEYIISVVGEKAKIAVFDVPSSGSVSALRSKGFEDYIEETGYENIELIRISEEGFSRDEGYNDMIKMLSEHNHIDAVFSMDDETSIGIVKAVTEAKRKDVKAITGGGGMQEYFKMIFDKKNSDMGLATVLYSPAMIEDAIEEATNLYLGKSKDRFVIIPTKLVTYENVGDYIDFKNTVY